jgi:5-(aminomethyl)-3-furanmethanol phosphate kinase
MNIRVIKVGGSLFDDQRLGAKLRSWLAAQPRAHQILLAGGGAFLDTIRAWDQSTGFPPVETHWLCIHHLDVTARSLSLLLPELRWVNRFQVLREKLQDPTPQLVSYSCLEFLRDWDRRIPGKALPENWTVTSDSIAARLADSLSADELVLIKSADPPEPLTPCHAANSGYVDRAFPEVVGQQNRVRCVNLRSGQETEMILIGSSG